VSDARIAKAAVVVAMLGIWIAALFVGYGEGKAGRSTNARQVTTATGIEFAVPPELADSPTPTGVLEALAITPLRVYSPAGNVGQGSVVVGYSRGTGPTLLGTRAARLTARSSPQVDELGQNVAVRVTGTIANEGIPSQVTVYSVPTTGGDAVVLCLAARNDVTASSQPDCERVATKLKIAPTSSIGSPISLDQLETYPHSLLATFTPYADAADGLRLRLSAARFSGEEQSLAAQLASLYARAARALAQPSPDPLVLPAQHLLYTGITRVLAGYNLLAHAAAVGGPRTWAQGRSQVAGAEATIAAALRQILTA
jgi:hypothetical protein